MNKVQLIEKISGEIGLSKREVQKAIDGVIGTIRNALSEGEKVTLVGFGTFRVASRKARRGVNPQTGMTIQIPTKKVPKFVAGKPLRERVE